MLCSGLFVRNMSFKSQPALLSVNLCFVEAEYMKDGASRCLKIPHQLSESEMTNLRTLHTCIKEVIV